MIINNLKMDLYRMVRQKSFYACLTILLILFNTANKSAADFLYFFPNVILLPLAVLLFLALFVNEEMTSGFIKHVYPLYQKKWVMLIERWLFTCVVYLCMWLVVVCLTLILVLFHFYPLGELSLLNYGAYSLMQMLVVSGVGSLVVMLNYIVRSNVITILYVLGYAFSILYAMHAYLSNFFIPYYQYTLYHISISLPINFEPIAYGKALCIIISSTLLYNAISYFVLKKRDIA